MKVKCRRLPVTKYRIPWTWKQEEFEKSMRDLKYIFATRKTLRKNGLIVIHRRFLSSRQKKAGQFVRMTQAYPTFYGEIGSDSWIQGILVHLNEPGVIAWDDIEAWLKDPKFLNFIEASQQNNLEISEVPIHRRFEGNKDDTAMLKTGFVKLVRCDDQAEVTSDTSSPQLSPSGELDNIEDVELNQPGTQANVPNKDSVEDSKCSTPTTIPPESEDEDIIFLDEIPRTMLPTITKEKEPPCTNPVLESSVFVSMPVTSTPELDTTPHSVPIPNVPIPVAVSTPAPLHIPDLAAVLVLLPVDMSIQVPISTPAPVHIADMDSVPVSMPADVSIPIVVLQPPPVQVPDLPAMSTSDVSIPVPISPPAPDEPVESASDPVNVSTTVPEALSPAASLAPARVHSCAKCVDNMVKLQGLLLFTLEIETEIFQRKSKNKNFSDLLPCLVRAKQRLVQLMLGKC